MGLCSSITGLVQPLPWIRSHGVEMELVRLLKFLSSVLPPLPPVEEENDDDTDAAGANERESGQGDSPTWRDEELHLP